MDSALQQLPSRVDKFNSLCLLLVFHIYHDFFLGHEALDKHSGVSVEEFTSRDTNKKFLSTVHLSQVKNFKNIDISNS